MKNNKLVFPVLIILLIVITPCAIYGTYDYFAKKIAGENPNHLHKFNNQLYYYDEKDTLIGTYTCENEMCDTATSTIDDEYLNYSDGLDYSLDTFNSYAIINDGEKIFLYSLFSNMKIQEILAVKTYGNKLNNKYLIIQRTDGNYGLFDKEIVGFVVPSEYQYLGVNEKYLSADDKTLILAAMKDNTYFIINAKGEKKSESYDYPIYDYDDRYVICINNEQYHIYDYEKNSIINPYGFDKVSMYLDNYITLANGQINVYQTEITTPVKTFSYFGQNIDYEINNNVLSIKAGDAVLDTYEFVVD